MPPPVTIHPKHTSDHLRLCRLHLNGHRLGIADHIAIGHGTDPAAFFLPPCNDTSSACHLALSPLCITLLCAKIFPKRKHTKTSKSFDIHIMPGGFLFLAFFGMILKKFFTAEPIIFWAQPTLNCIAILSDRMPKSGRATHTLRV